MERSSKRGKMQGRPASRNEVLDATGHPSEWARSARKSEKARRLRYGETELDLDGILGLDPHNPGFNGYLGFLERQILDPFGARTTLVNEVENARIRKMVITETHEEIEACRHRAAVLIRSPEALRAYVARMADRIEELRVPAEKPGTSGAQAFLERNGIQRNLDKHLKLLEDFTSSVSAAS